MSQQQKETITLHDGEWKVWITKTGRLRISDAKGKLRHLSKDHITTAIHLAMCIARTDELIKKLGNKKNA